MESIHYTTARVVKKKLNFFFGPFRPSFTHCVHTPFPRSKLFFFFKKNHVKENPCQKNLKTRRGKHRNVFVRRGEGHQTGSSWTEEYHATVVDMETNDLLKSTLTDESRKQKGDTRTCLFCGFRHSLSAMIKLSRR